MSSFVSLEYLNSLVSNQAGYKGEYTTVENLKAAIPLGVLGDYVYVDETSSFWYWNSKLSTPAWVNQNITVTDYQALTAVQKSAVSYVIVV